ncbi:unnamed protein product [Schistosoma curassoni]|uniref:Uncharacterized protein n=1 Tax=Schistosoma curassoni TaxID=6186 RepID=A0A183JE80_9TREM|nr:unnamed protein product [Schistosoma curassoni]
MYLHLRVEVHFETRTQYHLLETQCIYYNVYYSEQLLHCRYYYQGST